MKNDPVRLQSAEKLFERIAEQRSGRVEVHPDYMPRRPGWTPAPDHVVSVNKMVAHKGRDIESLMRYHEAHTKPVGYWEDAPTGPKFAQDSTCPKCGNMMVAGHHCTTGGADCVLTGSSDKRISESAPSSDNPYEPVWTVPVAGDRVVKVVSDDGGAPRGTTGEVESVNKYTGGFYCYLRGNERAWAPASDSFSRGAWRILKRQKAPQAQAPQGLKVRAWRGAVCDWVVAGGRYYVGPVRDWGRGQWERSNCDDSPMPKGWPELPAREALELWKACATALRLNFETGEPLQNKPVA